MLLVLMMTLAESIEVPLATLFALALLALPLTLILMIPDRILGKCVWWLTKILLCILSVPYLVAHWLFILPRPACCQNHSLFCRCAGCRLPEEEIEQLWRSPERSR